MCDLPFLKNICWKHDLNTHKKHEIKEVRYICKDNVKRENETLN